MKLGGDGLSRYDGHVVGEHRVERVCRTFRRRAASRVDADDVASAWTPRSVRPATATFSTTENNELSASRTTPSIVRRPG